MTGRAPVEPSVTSPRGVIITELVVELVVEPEVVPDPTVDFLEGPWYCCSSLVLFVNPKTPGDPVTFDGLWRVKMLSAVARRGSGIKSIKNFSLSKIGLENRGIKIEATNLCFQLKRALI